MYPWCIVILHVADFNIFKNAVRCDNITKLWHWSVTACTPRYYYAVLICTQTSVKTYLHVDWNVSIRFLMSTTWNNQINRFRRLNVLRSCSLVSNKIRKLFFSSTPDAASRDMSFLKNILYYTTTRDVAKNCIFPIVASVRFAENRRDNNLGVEWL